MSKKVKLIGIYGLYNFGCEAIVRGTYKLLKEADPNVEIELYTHTLEYDEKVISDLEIKVIQVEKKEFSFIIRILNKLGRILNISKQIRIEKLPESGKEDIFMSIGGDIYTLPKKDIDIVKYARNDLVDQGECILRKSEMIIWGASIGPFGSKKIVNDYFFTHFRKMKKIIVREHRSYEYLNGSGLNNVLFASDPAFFVKANKPLIEKKNKQLVIGINLSPLSIKENGIDANYDKYGKLIDDIISEFKCNIILLPHVISPLSEKDNDFIFLENIKKRVHEKNFDKVFMSNFRNGFLDIKNELINCDIVVTARMHCAINAICENIPTIFICYSQKGYGMCEYIYGDKENAVDLKEIDIELITKLKKINENKEQVKKKLKSKVKEIRNEEENIVELFRGLIE